MFICSYVRPTYIYVRSYFYPPPTIGRKGIMFSGRRSVCLSAHCPSVNTYFAYGARRIFSKGGQIVGLWTKVPHQDAGMEFRWGSGSEVPSSR